MKFGDVSGTIDAGRQSLQRFAFYVTGSLRLGGAERRFFRLFSHLHQRGYDLHLSTSEQGAQACRELGIETAREGVHLLRGPTSGRASGYLSLLHHALSLVLWVRRQRIRHLHFGQNPSAVTFAYSLLSVFGCPFSVSMVDSIKDYQRNWRERLYARVTARWATRIDCLSEQIKTDFCAFLGGCYENKCSVAPGSFTDPRPVDPATVKDIDVALVARMIPSKGHALLRLALSDLERDGWRDLVVHVCGSGPLEDDIRADFAAIHQQRIHIRYEPDPFQILQRSRIFVSLQEVENYPSQSLLEAMTCGCAIVATDVGLTRRLVDESCGVLIPADAAALAAALRRLLNNQDERSALGARARRVVTTQHTIDRFADYFVQDVLQAAPIAAATAAAWRKAESAQGR